jgi:drug/metabolite transporter (DMT)-like permease
VTETPRAASRRANLLKAILLKLASTAVFAVMSTLIRYVAQDLPVGQVVFFRSALAIPPIILIFAWRRELAAALRTNHPFGHVVRGLAAVVSMFMNFGALARLPLVDATALNFITPLMTVGLAAVLLRERVRIYRWSAVVIGFLGVLVMLLPHFDPAATASREASAATVGIVLALFGALFSAGAVIQTRRLTKSESTSSIVVYFSLVCALTSLPSLPFIWVHPTPAQWAALIVIGTFGGIGHFLLTESYRFSSASVIAPFDYTTLFWVLILGYFVFGEAPEPLVYAGAAIIIAAGLFVIWRERRLGLRRKPEVEKSTP